MNDIDQARSLLNRADKDLAALRAMCHLETVADEIFGFHTQQVVEKALKA
jgi:HEPN domain-containing protein